jgi:putative addiction module component
MSASTNIYLPINPKQLFELVRQLPTKEKEQLLGLLQQEREETMPIPEEHKRLVRQRIKKYTQHPEELLDWDTAKKSLKLD